ncbi:MAG: hypothetical protein K8T89_06860 [Planctomycetes bacterium]|nr:hypothetical protein [Planctomycetota bacterium]
MLRILTGTCFVIMGLSAAPIWAVPPQHAIAQASAEAIRTPSPKIVLKWKSDSKAKSWTLYRRSLGVDGADNWGAAINIPFDAAAKDIRYVDTAVTVGSTFEYRIDKEATSDGQAYTASTFLLAGLEALPIENRGKLILLVDDRFVETLRPELTRLVTDLTGDGWEVIRHDVPSSKTVRQVKAIIKADYVADPSRVNTVFLFGHFPVPYSGNIAPDGHREDHRGAWPADVFYGDMDDDLWTDLIDTTQLNKSVPRIAKHANVPGDGKFDPSTIPGDGKVELAVGRVDLANMPVFGVSETELLRRYLDKNHRYRHRVFDPQRRALNIDGFGFGEDGFRNFTPMLGFDKIAHKGSLAWFPSLRDDSYLWAYGAGGGQPTSCISIGTTTDFANNQVQSVFHILYGSFFGVWDDQDNLLRAPLASQPNGLASLWGKKYWTLHEMGLGRPIGFSVRRSQSREVVASPWNNGIQTALMGDPTLRMFMVAPPRNVVAKDDGGRGVVLSWEASPDMVAGYHVYRQTGAKAPMIRLTGDKAGTSNFVTGLTFTDANPPKGPSVYLVRAIKLETVNSGSYNNLSQGISVRHPLAQHQITMSSVGGSQQFAPTMAKFSSGTYQTLEVPSNTNPGGTSVCTWTGTGSVPAVGTGTSVRIYLDRESTIQWRWSANRDAIVNIVSPAPRQNFTQPAHTVVLESTAADPDGLISKVEFYLGKTLLGEDRDSVFDFVADPSGVAYRKNGQRAVASYRYVWKDVPDGKYTITAKAYDFFGGSTISAPVDFTVSGKNVPPTIAIDVPKQGATYKAGTARFNLQATCKDDGTITKVEYFLGTKSLGSSFASPYSFWQNLSPGTYTFTAKATDDQGATAISRPVTITVTAER